MNRIKEILTARGKSQTWLADELGMGRVVVSNWCNNNKQPSIPNLRKVAGILNINVRELLAPTNITIPHWVVRHKGMHFNVREVVKYGESTKYIIEEERNGVTYLYFQIQNGIAYMFYHQTDDEILIEENDESIPLLPTKITRAAK